MRVFLVFLMVLIGSISFAQTNSISNKYQEYYNNLGKYGTNVWRDFATRYVIISTEQPEIVSYPKIGISIYGDKTYRVTNYGSNFTCKFEYGTNKYDTFTFHAKQEIEVTFNGFLSNVSQVFYNPLGVYFGASLLYDRGTNQTFTILNLGYCFKLDIKGMPLLNNITFTPSIGINMPSLYMDFFFGVGYNVYQNINVGVAFSFLRQNPAITLGINL